MADPCHDQVGAEPRNTADPCRWAPAAAATAAAAVAAAAAAAHTQVTSHCPGSKRIQSSNSTTSLDVRSTPTRAFLPPPAAASAAVRLPAREAQRRLAGFATWQRHEMGPLHRTVLTCSGGSLCHVVLVARQNRRCRRAGGRRCRARPIGWS